MGTYHPPSDEVQMEMARRMGGGHPMSEIRGKEDVITAAKSKDPATLKAEHIATMKLHFKLLKEQNGNA